MMTLFFASKDKFILEEVLLKINREVVNYEICLKIGFYYAYLTQKLLTQ